MFRVDITAAMSTASAVVPVVNRSGLMMVRKSVEFRGGNWPSTDFLMTRGVMAVLGILRVVYSILRRVNAVLKSSLFRAKLVVWNIVIRMILLNW